ncbi:MAG: ParB/RepB/Spo0J family partition protein [Candidatus Fimenecus sp.]
MTKRKSGLGRGFDSLMISNELDNDAKPIKLAISDIEPNVLQPRKIFDEKALSELSDSIREHGVLQPLLVRPMPNGTYKLVAGERRFRASKIAGLSEVPVTIREMTDEQEQIFALIENLQREDLNAIEQAEGLKVLIDEFGLTQEEAAQRVGKSRSAVTNAIRLLALPDKVKEMVKNNKISMGHARALLSLADGELMTKTADEIYNSDLSVRGTEKLVKKLQNTEPPKPRKILKPRNSFYDEVELSLKNVLGREVRVLNGKNERGTVEIEYFSKEDLQNIAKKLGNAEDA